ncbi:CRISPR-associated endoribonuclease Cas6 [Hymenobacter rubripertinctus]|uniref:CRISPR-associated endoribonuclease Cas6 n=1 Tax=Hymenobacter rubripertinctus TaxID=2029981 RepID=A0A418QIX8_9BACT|nr:CRISPR-associated endoribonuclease Cas6 [Hymenobacter rubripertinctus]RIY05137.1 CRISPR-associated endoribonuclease Cas6 [Hymenobacter rubripertinctus]
MRLQLYLTARQALPFDHLPTLKGAFHRWAGHNNDLHDGLSLYSLSWLRGGRGSRNGLHFRDGAHWSISAHDPALIHALVGGVVREPDLGLGLTVRDARLLTPPPFQDGEQWFRVLSPVFIKWQTEKGQTADHLTHTDPRADELLTATLRHKLRQAGLDDAGAAVRFDRTYAGAKTKLFAYKNVQCRASQCPVIVTGTAEQIRFAWCVGVGNSTGLGCGALE